jgi:hypothetical protein
MTSDHPQGLSQARAWPREVTIMKKSGLYVLAATFALAALVTGTKKAQAQYGRYKGRILVSKKKPPEKAAKLKRWMRKETTRRLKSNKAGDKWEFHYVAVLRKTPKINVVNLVYYEYRGGRYKYINAEDVKITGQATLIIGKGKMHKLIGFKKGKRYQLRITVRDSRGNEIWYAKSRLILLK